MRAKISWTAAWEALRDQREEELAKIFEATADAYVPRDRSPIEEYEVRTSSKIGKGPQGLT
jgi:hypothetical protein